MAVTVDQANLHAAAQSGPTNYTFTTGAAVASGAMIVILAFKFRSGLGTHAASGGSLTWTTVHQVNSGSIMICMMAAFAPSGLASGTSLTVTATGSGSADWTVCAASYNGVDSSGGIAAAIRAFDDGAGSGTGWDTGAIGGNAADAYIGGAAGDGTLRTSTPGGDNVERIDFNSATTSGSITLVDDLDGAASDSIAGTWSGTLGHVAIGAAFIPAAGGGGGVTVKQLAALGVG